MCILLISVDSRHPEIYEDVFVSCIASLLYLISPCLRRQLLKYCKCGTVKCFVFFLSVFVFTSFGPSMYSQAVNIVRWYLLDRKFAFPFKGVSEMWVLQTLSLWGAFTAGKRTRTDVCWSETSQQSQAGRGRHWLVCSASEMARGFIMFPSGSRSLCGMLRARV